MSSSARALIFPQTRQYLEQFWGFASLATQGLRAGGDALHFWSCVAVEGNERDAQTGLKTQLGTKMLTRIGGVGHKTESLSEGANGFGMGSLVRGLDRGFAPVLNCTRPIFADFKVDGQFYGNRLRVVFIRRFFSQADCPTEVDGTCGRNTLLQLTIPPIKTS